MKDWKVVVKNKEGAVNEYVVRGGEEMDNQDAAVAVQHKVLGENFLLVNTPRGEKEPTVFLLKHYGYTIESIEEIKE